MVVAGSGALPGPLPLPPRQSSGGYGGQVRRAAGAPVAAGLPPQSPAAPAADKFTAPRNPPAAASTLRPPTAASRKRLARRGFSGEGLKTVRRLRQRRCVGAANPALLRHAAPNTSRHRRLILRYLTARKPPCSRP